MRNRMTAAAVPISLSMAVLVACATPATESPADSALTTSTSVPVPTAREETVVFEMMAVTTHPNGTQLRVDRIELLSDSTVVSGVVTNGSRFGISLDRGSTDLVTDTGEIVPTLGDTDLPPVPPGGELVLTLRFQPLGEPSALVLRLNRGGGSSPSDPSTSVPSFQLGPLALDAGATRPPLPDPVPVRRTVVDSAGAGVELRIEGINFTENRIGVWVRISNPLDLEVRIAPTMAPTLLQDDLGNRYPLVLPESETWISVPAGTARSGTLAFAGRIHPDASALDFGIHAGTDGVRDQDRLYPGLVVRAIPLAGETVVAPLPSAITASETMEHPAAILVTIGRVSFSETAIEVSVEISNQRGAAVSLASATTLLVDDLGNRHPLIPLPGNPSLSVAAGTVVEATLAFSGRIVDGAGRITLVFNAAGSEADPETTEPAFRFGPYELVRPAEPPEPIVARVFPVGSHSTLAPDELAVSEIRQITETLTRFGAIEIEGGFQLTLPDSILFDFGADELRSDAVPALTLIAEVLEYFEGDRVIVVGHTDSIGPTSRNQLLSEQRARTVVDALVREHGIDPGRLSAEGRGETEPVAPNETPDGEDDPEGRQLNRRVEIVVLTDRPLPLP